MRRPLLLLILIMIFNISATSQTTASGTVKITLPSVSLLDIEPSSTLNFIFKAPLEAGNPIENPAINTLKWINYTSAISSTGLNRRITAMINETIPGVRVRLTAAAATASGAGQKGTTLGTTTLSSTAQTIISGIGGAYTGNGINNGHQLSISIEVSTYTQMTQLSNKVLVITYTITE